MTGKRRTFSKGKLIAPVVCVALLCAAWAERARRLAPSDVEGYHARAKAAVEGVRYRVGMWTGADVEVPEAAQKLLRPNALLSRRYVDNRSWGRVPVEVSLLVVQCRDPRDMQGHYPPNCYPAHGSRLVGQRAMEIAAAGQKLACTEYRFAPPGGSGAGGTSTVVLNTLLIPGVGSTAEMKGVYAAAEDYQKRLFGAAQVQIVMPDAISAERRRAVYEEFLVECAPMIEALLKAEVETRQVQ